MVEQFYSAAAAACFTLLGLWWVVVDSAHRSWQVRPDWQRMSYHVSLYFLLPGVMSLIALVGDGTVLWGSCFAVMGAVGGGTAARMLASSLPGGSPHVRATLCGAAALYLGVAGIGVAAIVIPPWAWSMAPLRIAAVLLAILLGLGVNLAWWLFAGTRHRSPAAQPDRMSTSPPTPAPR